MKSRVLSRSVKYLVLEDFLNTIQLLDIQNQGSKLHDTMKMNPWLRDKIEVFIQHEKAQMMAMEDEFIVQSIRRRRCTDHKKVISFQLGLHSNACLLQQIYIGLLYGSIMELIYKNSVSPNDKYNQELLIKQHNLQLLISKYKENWNGTAPSLYVKTEKNSEIDEIEIDICRKQLLTHQEK
ncbi:hypothetical protein C0J52_26260 [Blattella germanica]|nr:hypothetical protein C0J52_26260 [Blattella germanica]